MSQSATFHNNLAKMGGNGYHPSSGADSGFDLDGQKYLFIWFAL